MKKSVTKIWELMQVRMIFSAFLAILSTGCSMCLPGDEEGMIRPQYDASLGACRRVLDDTKYPLIHGHVDPVSPEELKRLGCLNLIATDYFRREESAYYRKEEQSGAPDDALPDLGIAMSGGGIRSAAFNIGVLRGLHRIGRLSDADILSSVSGGSYASAWFFINQIRKNGAASPDELFALSDGSSLAVVDETLFVTKLWMVWSSVWGLVGQVFWGPASLFSDEFPTPTLASSAYYGSIITKFAHANPKWEKVREGIEAKNLPLPIVNATVSEGRGRAADLPLAQGAFESTPLRYGWDGGGYRVPLPTVTMLNSVIMSAAAVDRPQSNVQTWLGQSLGGRIRRFMTPSLDRSRECERHSIHLHDGGVTENLGAYALIKRLTGHIVIVDAEHDPRLTFTAYERLRKKLRTQHGVILYVGEIEKRLNSGVAMMADQFATPVMSGSITGIPFPTKVTGGDVEVAERKIDVTYVKLSLDKSKLSDYPPSVQEEYESQAGCRWVAAQKRLLLPDKPRRVECSFPQHSTFLQHYGEKRFRAYRELGEHLVMQNAELFGGVKSAAGR